jgi:ribosomal protein L39E
LTLAPCSLEEANVFVEQHHRHHHPTPVAKFAIAAAKDGVVVGVVIVGLPKARLAMDGWTLEVTRLATDGTHNACSLLYSAARRAAFALGYARVLTYTLAEEEGGSLRASGWTREADIKGESWKRRHRADGRFVDDRNPTGDKTRWATGAKRNEPVPVVVRVARELPLFADAVARSAGDSTD